MEAHLQEAAIEGALAADEDGIDGRLHVVVDAPLARALEVSERSIMRVEHHLLGLARIGAHEQHARVAQANVGNTDLGGDTADQDHFFVGKPWLASAATSASRCGGHSASSVPAMRLLSDEAALA